MTGEFKALHKKEGVCPVCEEKQAIEVGVRNETFLVKKEPITIRARVERCVDCGEYFADLEEEEANFQEAYREYRKHHNLLQPDEIQEIRERYGLGQRAFSRILGWGEITIHRYEAGAIQDEAHNATLQLLQDVDNFVQLFERHKQTLPASVRKRVEARLANLKEEKREDYWQQLLESQFMESRDDITSGFRHFDLDRFESAVLFFCAELSNVFKTKLNKLLWYFDFLTYKYQLRSATGAIYMHFQYGPVPKNYELYLANLVQENAIEVKEVIFDEERSIAGEVYVALEEPDLSLFNSIELGCLKAVSKYFENMSAREISRVSHDEEGYRQTNDREVITYEWSKDLKVPINIGRGKEASA